MKLNHWTKLKVTRAQLGTRNAKQATPRSELDKVQARFSEQEPTQATQISLEEALQLLPVGCWRMINTSGIWTVNLYDSEVNSGKERYVTGFTSREVQVLSQKIEQWKHEQDTKDYPSLCD